MLLSKPITRKIAILSAAAFSSLSFGAITSTSLRAEDPPAKTVAKPEAKSEEPADPYKVPETEKPEVLVEFIKSIKAMRPTRYEATKHVAKGLPAITDAAEKILKLEKDPNSTAAKYAKEVLLGVRVNKFGSMSATDQKKLYEEVKAVMAAKAPEELQFTDLSMAMNIARAFDYSNKTELAIEVNNSFAEIFGKSNNPQIVMAAKSLAGSARRMGLVGKEIEIKGKTMSGKDFDIASLRGKVVLVDFWATWCGPCIAEHPNLVRNYDKYHEKGFEVVGISLDSDREALEEFIKEHKTPWTTLHQTDGRDANAIHYGITGIPTVILVNREGKVISMTARGPMLGKLLAKEFPEEEKTEEKPAEDKK